MERLNEDATKIVIRFMELVKDRGQIRIPLVDDFTVQVNKGDIIETGDGRGYLLGIGRIIDLKVLTYEPYWRFIVVDKRDARGEGDVFVFPVLYRDDYNQVTQESCRIRYGKITGCSGKLQAQQVEKAFEWLLELQTAGYI